MRRTIFLLTLAGAACGAPSAAPSPDLASAIDPAIYIDIIEDTRDTEQLTATKAVARAYADRYDSDGEPLRLRWDEYRAMMTDPHLGLDTASTRSLRNTLGLLRPLFFDELFVVNDPGPRVLGTTSNGARVEHYANSDCYLAYLNLAIDGLANDARFAATLAATDYVVTPPDGGFELLPEFGPGYEEYGGMAMPDGLDDRHVPTMVIRADSFDTWDLTFAHELLHLYYATLSSADRKLIAAEYKRFTALPTFATNPDPYLSAFEMFAFFGQWYLAGHGDLIAAKSAPLAELYTSLLGTSRVSQRGAGPAKAEAHLALLWKQYSTGIINPADYDALAPYETESSALRRRVEVAISPAPRLPNSPQKEASRMNHRRSDERRCRFEELPG